MKWHNRFLKMAELVATWSKDPSTNVGAVIVDQKRRVISTGYNGFPAGTDDSDDLYEDRDVKLAKTLHAEANAILFAKQDLSGCKIYITAPPCSNCAAMIIQAGITNVYCATPSEEFMKRWMVNLNIAQQMLCEASVKLDMI